MGFDSCLGEVQAGGALGLCGLDQIDWGGQAGAFYECWRLSPCCGSPDLLGALLCCVHWTWCSPCSMCKLYASSLGERCSLWPHCCCILLLPFGRLFTRYNLRKRSGVSGNMVGDCVCIYCCAPCTFCQELRSVNAGAWRIFPECEVPGLIVPGCRFIK